MTTRDTRTDLDGMTDREAVDILLEIAAAMGEQVDIALARRAPASELQMLMLQYRSVVSAAVRLYQPTPDDRVV